jgi:hypothetical protein
MENIDSKFIRALSNIIAWIFTTGWIIYALVIHNWLLLVAVITSCIGATIIASLKK